MEIRSPLSKVRRFDYLPVSPYLSWLRVHESLSEPEPTPTGLTLSNVVLTKDSIQKGLSIIFIGTRGSDETDPPSPLTETSSPPLPL